MHCGGTSRVLVVDDDEIFRRACGRALSATGYEVGEAGSCREGTRSLRRHPWQVVLLDLMLEDGSGASLLPLIDELVPAPGVAVISGCADAEATFALAQRGVLVLPKPVGFSLLLSVVATLLERSRRPPLIEAFADEMRLSDREREVLRLAYDGRTPAEIARQLICAKGTVRTYFQRIFEKTSCRSQRDVFALLLRFQDRRRLS